MLVDDLKKYQIVLVSQSPRRRELLQGLEIDFTSTSVDTNEAYPSTLQGADVPLFIAKAKADAYRPQLQPNTLAITADTVVCIDGKILGKPSSYEDAFAMLKELSGRHHEVITAVCLLTQQKQHSFYAVSEVYFSQLTDEEINHYLTRYRPYDKAGSYGIQEWIGFIGIEKISGSYFNVMGLPIQKLYQELKTFIHEKD